MKFFLRIKPPFWAIIYLFIGLVLHFIWLWNGGPRKAFYGVGVLILLLGFGLMFWAWKLFHVKGTAICPFDEPTQFITQGPYRFTRNPMYLGMTLILTGIALSAGTPPIFLAPLAFWATVRSAYIPFEEEKMARIFGRVYLDYKSRVRRWI